MAGTVDLMQRCYLGVEIRADAIWFDPRLPPQVESVETALRFRGEWIDVAVAGGRLRVSTRASASGPVRVGLRGRVVELKPGETASVDIQSPG
jgi:alpha,alpha-trehalase